MKPAALALLLLAGTAGAAFDARAGEPCNPYPECNVKPKRKPPAKPLVVTPLPKLPGIELAGPITPTPFKTPETCIVDRPKHIPPGMPYPCEYQLKPEDGKVRGVPEADTWALVCLGLGTMIAMKRRKCA